MRNPIYIAIVCGVLLAVSGCNKAAKVEIPPAGTDSNTDWRYQQSLLGLRAEEGFAGFLKTLQPSERVTYINKSLEDGPMRIYMLKGAYEQYTKDPNPEVAAAAKEALTKVPTPEEYADLKKEQMEKLKP